MTPYNLATYAVIDIETVPNDKAADYFKSKTYEPDARLKDPEKIQQSILEKRQKDMDKAALSWWTGQVICISAQLVAGTGKPTGQTWAGCDEKTLLVQFFDWLYEANQFNSNLTIIGKSSDYFDTPFLIGRALSHDLGLLDCLRPYRSITDLDHIFSFSSQCDQRTNLANYAFGLGIAGKNGHGSMVSTMYAEAMMGDETKWKSISEYCAQDNAINIELLKRWLKPYIPSVTPFQEQLEIPFGG